MELVGPEEYDHPMLVPRGERPDMIDAWEQEESLFHPTNPPKPIY